MNADREIGLLSSGGLLRGEVLSRCNDPWNTFYPPFIYFVPASLCLHDYEGENIFTKESKIVREKIEILQR